MFRGLNLSVFLLVLFLSDAFQVMTWSWMISWCLRPEIGIPADCSLIWTMNLVVNEGPLTGESRRQRRAWRTKHNAWKRRKDGKK